MQCPPAAWLVGEGRWCLSGEQTHAHTLCTLCLLADHSTHPWGPALQCESPGCLPAPGHSEVLMGTWTLSPLSSSSSSQPPTGQVVLAQRPLGNLSKVRSSRRSQTGLWPGSGYALTAAPGRRGGLVSKSCQLGCQLLWVRPHLLLGAQWGQPG